MIYLFQDLKETLVCRNSPNTTIRHIFFNFITLLETSLSMSVNGLITCETLVPELLNSTYDGVVMGMTSSGIHFLLEAQSASSLRVDAQPASSLRVDAQPVCSLPAA
jgi:hypothetical protein